jgi:hypothetical protein
MVEHRRLTKHPTACRGCPVIRGDTTKGMELSLGLEHRLPKGSIRVRTAAFVIPFELEG